MILILIALPLVAGLAQLAVPAAVGRRFLPAAAAAGLVLSAVLYFRPPAVIEFPLLGAFPLILRAGGLAGAVLVLVNLFGLLVSLYSQDDPDVGGDRWFWALLGAAVAASSAVCLAGDFLTLAFAWGATLAILYWLLRRHSDSGASKALSVVGFGDFCFILGACIYMAGTGSTALPTGAHILLNNSYSWSAFILMLAGAFAKAGCGPLHTWIPAASESASAPVMALLPASLDKLLGVYLLARVCGDFFLLNETARMLLLAAGSATIMFAVMLALVQHDLRKLLAYHAVSQVGYMVIGFGTGSALGVAGALFHMANNALYKSGLFLAGGAAGHVRGTFELERLGGLARYMPVTFAAALIFSLSISGLPPLNGFASKWLLYQAMFGGIVTSTSPLQSGFFVAALLAAMFGSVLTLASFIKFMHAVFLGQPAAAGSAKEVPGTARAALGILAACCIGAGLLPGFVIDSIIEPAIGEDVLVFGSWSGSFTAVWLLAGLGIGYVAWRALSSGPVRRDGFFVGGEPSGYGPRFPATEFYRTFDELPWLRRVYRIMTADALDAYNVICASARCAGRLLHFGVDRCINALTVACGYAVLGCSYLLRRMHTGSLDVYMIWSCAGLVIMLAFIMGR